MGRVCLVSNRLFQPSFLLWKPLPLPWSGPHVSAPASLGWPQCSLWSVASATLGVWGQERASFPARPHWPLPLHYPFLPTPSSKAGINSWEGGTQVLQIDLALKTQEPQNNEGAK